MIVDIDYEIRKRGVYRMMNQEIGDKNMFIDSKLGGGRVKIQKNVY